MNRYTFEDCQIGKKESFEAEITEEKMEAFRMISGDVNPLHTDEDFAQKKGFETKVVYGLLTASFFSTLVGVYLPGERCLIQETNFKFLKPVHILCGGGALEITGEVADRDERTKQLMLKVRIRRKSDNALVVRGKMTVGVLEDKL